MCSWHVGRYIRIGKPTWLLLKISFWFGAFIIITSLENFRLPFCSVWFSRMKFHVAAVTDAAFALQIYVQLSQFILIKRKTFMHFVSLRSKLNKLKLSRSVSTPMHIAPAYVLVLVLGLMCDFHTTLSILLQMVDACELCVQIFNTKFYPFKSWTPHFHFNFLTSFP